MVRPERGFYYEMPKLPEILPGLNRICRNYLSYLFAAIFCAIGYFFLWGADLETGVAANEQRSTATATTLNRMDEKLDKVAEDTAATKAIVERLERGQ